MPLPKSPLLSHLFTESGDPDWGFGNYTKYGGSFSAAGFSATLGSTLSGSLDTADANAHEACVISPAFAESDHIEFSFELMYNGIGVFPTNFCQRNLITFFGNNGTHTMPICSLHAYDSADDDTAVLQFRRNFNIADPGEAFFVYDDGRTYKNTGTVAISEWDESTNYPHLVSPFNEYYTISGEIQFRSDATADVLAYVDGVKVLDLSGIITSTDGLLCTNVGFSGGMRASNARNFTGASYFRNFELDRFLKPDVAEITAVGGTVNLPIPIAPPSIMTAGGYQMPPAEFSPVVLTGGDPFVPVEGVTLSFVPTASGLANSAGAEFSILPGSISSDVTIIAGAELAVVASAPRVFSDGPTVALAAGSAMPISEVATMSMTAHGGLIDALYYGGADMSATAGNALFPPAAPVVTFGAGAATLFDPAFAAVAISAGAASYASNGPAYTLTAGTVDEPTWAGAPMSLTAGSAAGSVFSPNAAEITFSARRMPNADAPLFVQVANGAVVGHSTASVKLLEETTARYTAQFTDENDANVPLSAFDTVMLTVYTKLGTIRATETALNENRVAISATGGIVWSIQPYETEITTGVTLTNLEEHFAMWEWTHSAEEIDRVVSPFTTAADSNLVTVSHASHGLRADDHIVVQGSLPVGGLHLDGLLIVDSVTNADTYIVRHKSAATSTASGGGACEFHINPQVGKGEYSFRVKKVDSI